MNTTLSLKNISKHFRGHTRVFTALDSLNFDFHKGVSYALVGASGSGKSTLIHICAGIETPSSGTVLLDGTDIHTFPATGKMQFLAERIGVVLQSPFLIPELTVLENVIFKDLINYSSRQKSRELGYSLLKELNLEEKAHEYPPALSGGQAQRVSLLRALYNKPHFLLADEPIAHLDHENQQIILSFLKKAQTEWGMGIIVSSHSAEFTKSLDIIYTLDNNRAKNRT